jgi:hypothetical protein
VERPKLFRERSGDRVHRGLRATVDRRIQRVSDVASELMLMMLPPAESKRRTERVIQAGSTKGNSVESLTPPGRIGQCSARLCAWGERFRKLVGS